MTRAIPKDLAPDGTAKEAVGPCEMGRLFKILMPRMRRPSAKQQSSCFVMEVSLRALHQPAPDGESGFGVSLYDNEMNLLSFLILPDRGRVSISWLAGAERLEQDFILRETFNPNAFHLLRMEVDGPWVSLRLDDSTVRWQGRLDMVPSVVALVTQNMAAAFAGFASTIGWEDLFTRPNASPDELGWQAGGLSGAWRIADARLVYEGIGKEDGAVMKGPLLEAYEMVVNARLESRRDDSGCYGFYPASGLDEQGPLFALEFDGRGYELVCQAVSGTVSFALPDSFDPFIDQQFRFRQARRSPRDSMGGALAGRNRGDPRTDASRIIRA